MRNLRRDSRDRYDVNFLSTFLLDVFFIVKVKISTAETQTLTYSCKFAEQIIYVLSHISIYIYFTNTYYKILYVNSYFQYVLTFNKL